MVGLLVAAVAYEGASARLGILGACAVVLWIVGTADDRLNISPVLRLGLEIALAVVLYATGNGWSALDIGPLDLLLTIVWVVGIVNAVNLMDNMDGAAATVVGISATGTGALAIVAGDPTLAALCFGLAGALCRVPAAQPGAAVADLHGRRRQHAAGPPDRRRVDEGRLGRRPRRCRRSRGRLILGLVILDTTLVTVSRRRGGRPLMTGGRDHLTHRLRTASRRRAPSRCRSRSGSWRCARRRSASPRPASPGCWASPCWRSAARDGRSAASSSSLVRRPGGKAARDGDARDTAAARA